MVEKTKVLIFPAGSEIAHDIFNSLRYNLHVELFAASGKPDDARFLYDEKHYVEDELLYVNHPDFIASFNKLLINNKIDMIMPTHDTITLYLVQHAAELSAKVLSSDYETALVARQKSRTYDLFKDDGICPEIYEAPFENLSYPVFIKPDQGQGAKNTALCENRDQLDYYLANYDDLLVCEYLPGDELSVDCFTDRHGKLLFAGPRTRNRVQMGITFHSASVEITDEIQHIADLINTKLKIRGAWFFQIKKDKNGTYKLLEFAVRQASTMGLYRQVGVNFALLSIFDMQNLDVKILKNDYPIELERSLYNRYKSSFSYDTVYIDFDDCVVVNDTVNEAAIRYLYYCKRKNKKVILLTKHRFDINATLEKYCIHTGLFNEIVTISDSEDKAQSITEPNAVFIDNYFFDRDRVMQEKNIPVFDVDAIEALIEES